MFEFDARLRGGGNEALHGLNIQAAGGAISLARRERKLAGRIDAIDAWRSFRGAHAGGLIANFSGEALGRRKVSDVDRDEQLAASIGIRRVAVERAHLRPEGAVRETAAQKVDHE